MIYTSGNRNIENKDIVWDYQYKFEVWDYVDVNEKRFNRIRFKRVQNQSDKSRQEAAAEDNNH